MKHFLLFKILIVLFININANLFNRKSHCVNLSPDLIYDKPFDLPSYGCDKIKLSEKNIHLNNLFESFLYTEGEKDPNFLKFIVKEKCRGRANSKNRMEDSSNSSNKSTNIDSNKIESSDSNDINNYLSIDNNVYKIIDFKIATNEDRMYHTINGEKFNVEFIFSLHSSSKEYEEIIKLSVFFKINEEMAKIYTDTFFDDLISKLNCKDECNKYYSKFHCLSLSNYLNDKSNYFFYTFSSPNLYCGVLKWIVFYDIFPISMKNYQKLIDIESAENNSKNIRQVIKIEKDDIQTDKIQIFKNKKIFNRQSSNLESESTEQMKNVESCISIPSVFYFSPNEEIEKKATCKSNDVKEYYEFKEGDLCIEEKSKIDNSVNSNTKVAENKNSENSKNYSNSTTPPTSELSGNSVTIPSKNNKISNSSNNSKTSENSNKANSKSNSSSNEDQAKSVPNTASNKSDTSSSNSGSNNSMKTPNDQPNPNDKSVVVTVDNNTKKSDMYIVNNSKIQKVDTNSNSSNNSSNEKNTVIVTNSHHHNKSSSRNHENNSNVSSNSQNKSKDSADSNKINGNSINNKTSSNNTSHNNISSKNNIKSDTNIINNNNINNPIINSTNSKIKNNKSDNNYSSVKNEKLIDEKNELDKKIIENINNIKNNINNIKNNNNIINSSNNKEATVKNSINNSKNNFARNIRSNNNSSNNEIIQNNKSSNNIKQSINSNHPHNNNYNNAVNNQDIFDPYSSQQSNIYNTIKSSTSDLDFSNDSNNKNTIESKTKYNSISSSNNSNILKPSQVVIPKKNFSNNTVLGTEIGIRPKNSKYPVDQSKLIPPPPNPPSGKTQDTHSDELLNKINSINFKNKFLPPPDPTFSDNSSNNHSASSNNDSKSNSDCSESNNNSNNSNNVELSPIERLHNAIKNKEIPKIYKNQKINYSKEGNLEINETLVIGDY